MKKKKTTKKSAQRMSNSKLMFLSIVLLFIVFEALYIVKGQISTPKPQVAGISNSR